MPSLNALLVGSGLDPKAVQLVRHKQSSETGKSPYSLWRSDKLQFEAYQNLQKREVFTRDWVASFVVTPAAETLFVGLYRNEDHCRTPSEFTCPVTDRVFQSGTMWIYSLVPDEQLFDLSERLIVDWGAGFRSWVQGAESKPKAIVEIKKAEAEPDFPGFDRFSCRIRELNGIWDSWKKFLAAQRGVYLLSFEDGQQYVGSATGAAGFWQRWGDYLVNGHGGNVALKNRDARDAVVSILDTARLSDSSAVVIDREMLWQRKLGPKAIALDHL